MNNTDLLEAKEVATRSAWERRTSGIQGEFAQQEEDAAEIARVMYCCQNGNFGDGHKCAKEPPESPASESAVCQPVAKANERSKVAKRKTAATNKGTYRDTFGGKWCAKCSMYASHCDCRTPVTRTSKRKGAPK